MKSAKEVFYLSLEAEQEAATKIQEALRQNILELESQVASSPCNPSPLDSSAHVKALAPKLLRQTNDVTMQLSPRNMTEVKSLQPPMNPRSRLSPPPQLLMKVGEVVQGSPSPWQQQPESINLQHQKSQRSNHVIDASQKSNQERAEVPDGDDELMSTFHKEAVSRSTRSAPLRDPIADSRSPQLHGMSPARPVPKSSQLWDSSTETPLPGREIPLSGMRIKSSEEIPSQASYGVRRPSSAGTSVSLGFYFWRGNCHPSTDMVCCLITYCAAAELVATERKLKERSNGPAQGRKASDFQRTLRAEDELLVPERKTIPVSPLRLSVLDPANSFSLSPRDNSRTSGYNRMIPGSDMRSSNAGRASSLNSTGNLVVLSPRIISFGPLTGVVDGMIPETRMRLSSGGQASSPFQLGAVDIYHAQLQHQNIVRSTDRWKI